MKINKAKLAFIYAFLGIILIASIVTTVYFFNVNAQIDDKINSAHYIDMAIEFDRGAFELVEQQESFSSLFLTSLIVSIVVLLVVVGVIVLNVMIAKKNKKKANVIDEIEIDIDSNETEIQGAEKDYVENVAEDISNQVFEEPQIEPIYCLMCGKRHDIAMDYCDECGSKLK